MDKLVESNARTAQAILDSMAEARLEREELRGGTQRMEDVMVRLANLQEGMGKWLTALDEDRPTVLRKLNAIENKVDRLLERQEDNDN
ncbi:MAG: hypothetical protein F6K35_44405 [Okeania sp. SIO2H7]|nr:hypothetical protein [Okeania sp. SIO2H7]